MIKSKTVRLYTLIVLTSLEIIIAFSAIGYLNIGSVVIPLVNLPVVIGAMALGPIQGTFLGFVFGVTNLFRVSTFGVSDIDILFAPAKSGDPVASLILTIGTRVLFGLLAAVIFQLCKRNIREEINAVTAYASISMLLFDMISSISIYILFGVKVINTVEITGVLFGFAINLLISVIILQMVYRILTNSKTLELFSIADETSFEVMNKKMKFFITFIMAAGLLVVVVGLFGEYFFRTLSIMDKGTSQYKYFIASSIQVFIPIVLATITAVICIRYYAFFALSESQRNLEMINLLPGGVVCLDANAENNEVLVHYASDGVMGVFGIDDEDGINIIGKNALDYCHPEDVYKLVHFIKTFDLNSPEFELVYRVYNRKKGYIWVSLRGALAKKIGNNIRVYAMFLDIDDQVKHNNELKQKYMEGQMVNDVIANNAICSFYLNLTKNECKLETNQYGDEMEWAKDISNLDTLLKKASERNTNMDSLLGYQKLFNREHLTSNFALGKTSYIYEHNFMITDRVIKWVETRVALMTNPETNDIEGYMYTLDIDEHKNTQIITQRVLSGEYEYVELINIIDDSLTMYISRPFDDYGVDTKKLTYSKLLENHMSRIVVESERSDIKAKMSVATIVRELENRRLYTCAFTINTDDGQRRKLFQYQYLDKFRKNIIMTQSDITEVYEEDQRKADILRNALKAAEEANSAKNDFFSRISHDLRTPLNAVITLSNLAVNENDVIKLQEYMSKIAVSGEYLLALTNDILDIAQIENDMVRVKLAPGTLSSCMDDVFNIIKPQCEAKNLELTYTPGSFVDTPVLIDISRVRQVLINLLSNAIKFTPENGKIWLTIEQQRTKDAMIINRIHVRDNGIGMSKEFCETAFDPFSGAYAYDRSNEGGTGLGLPIVKKLINMMGGEISLSSEENIGTEFVVEIAFRESLQDSVDVDEIATPDYNFTGKTFLLVEDNVINTEIAIILLTKAGANVEAVDNGLKAVLRMQDDDAEYKFDAVLMDIQMPVLDGLKAAKAIRNINTDYTTHVPIIAMTANAFDSDVQKSLEEGMNAHISKPIDPKKLFAILDEEIKNAKYEGVI